MSGRRYVGLQNENGGSAAVRWAKGGSDGEYFRAITRRLDARGFDVERLEFSR